MIEYEKFEIIKKKALRSGQNKIEKSRKIEERIIKIKIKGNIQGLD
jgi:hypothetical protein